MNSTSMTPAEIRSSLILGLIFFLRMFGLFLILPVFSIFASDFNLATPTLVGLALGIYGLSQALFQIPFGVLSDRLGRKFMVIAGLSLFIIGSLVAALSTNIYWLIFGRAIQGAGAIASVILALTADQISIEHRTKAMALIGMSVGLAFFLAFIISPILSDKLGFSGLFYLTAGLAMIAIFALISFVTEPKRKVAVKKSLSMNELLTVLLNKSLLGLNLGIFTLHLTLMAVFVVVPIILTETIQISTVLHWKIYLPVMLISILIMAPFIMLADRKSLGPVIYTGMVGVLLVSQFGFVFVPQTYWPVFISLTVFFVAFNFLEATLPALISKIVDPNHKGAALGAFSSSQFIGTFMGGLLGGYIYGHHGYIGVFMMTSLTGTHLVLHCSYPGSQI